MTITSKNNDLMVILRKLQQDRSFRYTQGLFVCEGRKLLDEALMHGASVQTVLYTEGAEIMLPDGVKGVEVTETVMKSVSQLSTPSQYLFTCKIPEQTQCDDFRGALVLDGVQDPGNLGTVIRTANALCVDRLILLSGCADPYNPKVVRSTMGALFRQKIYQMERQEFVFRAKSQGTSVIATALLPGCTDVRKTRLAEAAVVIGSEGQGVSPEILQAADRHVIIPMAACCESMNAAVAASIIMWEMKRDIL